MATTTTKFYLHGNKEENYEHGKALGLTGEVLEQFVYACYEVCITAEVDLKTGYCRALFLESSKVDPPVNV